MQSIPDITFVGGGVTALLSARLFALAGASVTIIERHQIGHESSWAGGGILLPLYPWQQADAISQLVMPSISTYPELAQSLIETTGLDPEYIVSGLLIAELDDFDKAQDWCHQYNISCSSVGAEFLNGCSSINGSSLYLDQIAQVRNPRLLKSLKQDLIQRGVSIIEQCAIEKVSLKNGHITQISSATENFLVNSVVITAGAWTGHLWTQLLGTHIQPQADIFPVKGQMIIFDTPMGTLDKMVLKNDRYLIPRRDGKILCGSTVEYADFDKSTTIAAQQSLANFARELLPALESAPIIHHWAGLRPGTEQGIPYIDKHPVIANLAINAGHFRNGFAMGPASAQLLFELITEQRPIIDLSPYQLSARH